jgi:NIMA (never in mitosis gene a)-related kinase 1/4/5
MRPSCDKILEMPVVRKKVEKLFGNDFFFDEEPQLNLLSTIRVPKNLLYLTDRLPKPMYDSAEHDRREKEELLRRRTYEGNGGSQMLPDVQSNGSDGGNRSKVDRKSESSKIKKHNVKIGKQAAVRG